MCGFVGDWGLEYAGDRPTLCTMDEITFNVSPCEDSGVLVASWDAPEGGGITTEGRSMNELRTNVREAVACHFEKGGTPARIRCSLQAT